MKRGWILATVSLLYGALSLLSLGLVVANAGQSVQGAPSPQTLKVLEFLTAADPALGALKIKHISLGDIDLSTGRIVAVDPLTLFGSQNIFTTIVAPGHYPVSVYAQDTGGGDVRIGLAEMRFGDAAVVTWKMAVGDQQDVTTLKGDEIFGFAVDAGLGSFMSPEALNALEIDMKSAETNTTGMTNYYTDRLAKELEKSTPNAIIYAVPSSPKNKIAMFHSGWGDGFYPSYFGFDSTGKPVTLVTTFFVLEEES